jgi:chromosome segregation ATPase
MRKLKLFSTPKISQSQRGEINVKIQAESPKPRLNLSIISSEDEFLSCDEMHQSKENIANISGTEPKRAENSSHHLKATERLSQILNSLSISNYAEAENRILQLEKENLVLKSRIGELEKGENNSEVDKMQNKMNKLIRKEEKYRTQINLLIERIEYLNENARDIKAQCKRYKSDRDLYKSQLNTNRDEKIQLEKRVWELENDLDAEQFKRDKAELRIDQIKREMSFKDMQNRTGSFNFE